MKELFIAIKNGIKKHKTAILAAILGILLVISLIITFQSWSYARDLKRINENNITALTDSVEFYKSKSGQLVAEKTLLMGDMNTLRLANKELADKIEDMKIHNPQQVVYVETVIENEVHDTTWMVESLDTTIIRNFDFSNDWRTLAGFVKLENKDLSLSIDKDKVLVNYTLAIKDNKVYLMSDNPYVTYNEVQGLTLPNTKKRFSIGVGPTISYGWWPGMTKPSPYFGISAGIYWNLFQF